VSTAIDDGLWSAVGDPTRRRMLDLLLAYGGGTATTLSERLPVTRQAVAKHLGVLNRVGLVHMTPAGRERRYDVDEAQLARAVAQLSAVGATWDARLQRIKRIAERIQRSKPADRTITPQFAATSVAAPNDRPLKRARNRNQGRGNR
jgi:DNA-binding transcriptional ArsR family regulator